jgi:hypothetical protein
MILDNGRFTHAAYSSSKQNLILALWYDNETKGHTEIAIKPDLVDANYKKLLDTYTPDEISMMTDQKRKLASQNFEMVVKDIALKYGLIYDPAVTNPQDKLIVDHLFNPPAGDTGTDLLFNIKSKIFDLPAVTQSINTELKKKLREAKTPLESLHIAGKFLYE